MGDIFLFLKRSARYALHKSHSNEIVEKVVVDLRFKNKINSKQHAAPPPPLTTSTGYHIISAVVMGEPQLFGLRARSSLPFF